MIVRFRVDERLPLPARAAASVVQTALKVNKKTALQLIHDGFVSCRGRLLSQGHQRLEVGDELEIDYAPQPKKTPTKKSSAPRAQFEIVHDDDSILVVNKPAGLLTVPSPHREKNTLLSQLQKWLDKQPRVAKAKRPEAICVHRLDRGVSGLLVFAKNEEVAQLLISQFAGRKPKREYVAVVQGSLSPAKGTIQSHLTTDPQSLNRYSVDDEADGELAITHYQVREQWRGVSLVSVKLETGRRNQIRVHLAEAGHPIVGDPRYRPQDAEHPLWPFKRIALHAESLGFQHPIENEPLLFNAPWPQEFRDLRRKLKTMDGKKKSASSSGAKKRSKR